MELIGIWFITATSPLGKETYNLRLHGDGSGAISHDRGSVDFSDAQIANDGDSMSVKIIGRTEIPMSVDFILDFRSSGKSLAGTAKIGEYATVTLQGAKI
jgi:hypothetical protein